VPGFLEGWVKKELQQSLVLTESLEQHSQARTSRRLPIKEVNLEITMAAAAARGLELRRCWRIRKDGACSFVDKCFDSHAPY
jgi:hypothetical protein